MTPSTEIATLPGRSPDHLNPRFMSLLRLLCASALLALFPIAGLAQSTPATLAVSRQLTDWLGVDALLEQTPQILAQALQAEARQRDAPAATQAQWRQALSARTQQTPLREYMARQLAQAVTPQVLQQAAAALDAPLPRRARYFDLAMAQPGAGLGFQAFRLESKTQPSTATPARRQLIKAIVDSNGDTLLLAQWQTTLGAAVEQVASGQAPVQRLQDDAVRERMRFLAPRAEEYALYAYRYLTDAELQTYLDQLRSAEVQQVLEVCRHHLARALSD